MESMSWDDKLSVKVKIFDEQHKSLFSCMDQIEAIISGGDGTSHANEIEQILKQLLDYTTEHFTLEERYMKKYKYPEYESHKREHARFVGKIEEFYRDFQQKKETLTIELMQFLIRWLSQHIKVIDKKYSDFFNRQGVS